LLQVRTWVGADVHARRSLVCVLDARTGEVCFRRVSGPPLAVIEVLETLLPPICAVYEAGPTGFGLARAGQARGLDVRVCAPASVPRPSNRVKTDRADAERLVRQLAAGALRWARVPSEAEEQLRDLTRAREAVRVDLMRARHRLSKFLLRRDLRFPGPGGAWTQPYHRWLRQLEFTDTASRLVLADYHAAVIDLEARRRGFDADLARAAENAPCAATIARLRCFRGVDTLSALGLCVEIGDFTRFPHPSQLSGYLGIVPSESTSDARRRQGGITRAGSPHARRLLVEAAQHYRRRPAIGRQLARRQDELADPRISAIAWRAQHRLYRRWQHLAGQRRKPSGTTSVACARELATFLWEAATLP